MIIGLNLYNLYILSTENCLCLFINLGLICQKKSQFLKQKCFIPKTTTQIYQKRSLIRSDSEGRKQSISTSVWFLQKDTEVHKTQIKHKKWAQWKEASFSFFYELYLCNLCNYCYGKSNIRNSKWALAQFK